MGSCDNCSKEGTDYCSEGKCPCYGCDKPGSACKVCSDFRRYSKDKNN